MLVLDNSTLYAPSLTLPRSSGGQHLLPGNAESLLRTLRMSAGQRLEPLLLWLAGLLS